MENIKVNEEKFIEVIESIGFVKNKIYSNRTIYFYPKNNLDYKDIYFEIIKDPNYSLIFKINNVEFVNEVFRTKESSYPKDMLQKISFLLNIILNINTRDIDNIFNIVDVGLRKKIIEKINKFHKKNSPNFINNDNIIKDDDSLHTLLVKYERYINTFHYDKEYYTYENNRLDNQIIELQKKLQVLEFLAKEDLRLQLSTDLKMKLNLLYYDIKNKTDISNEDYKLSGNYSDDKMELEVSSYEEYDEIMIDNVMRTPKNVEEHKKYNEVIIEIINYLYNFYEKEDKIDVANLINNITSKLNELNTIAEQLPKI
jgi:hypothetical protein